MEGETVGGFIECDQDQATGHGSGYLDGMGALRYDFGVLVRLVHRDGDHSAVRRAEIGLNQEPALIVGQEVV